MVTVIKNELKNRLLLQIKSGKILDILWAFLIKELFHSRLLDMRSNISNMRCSVSSPDETPRRELKNTTRSGVFLTNFEVFHLEMKHCVECLIFLLKQNHF